jgi:hypothetical protein
MQEFFMPLVVGLAAYILSTHLAAVNFLLRKPRTVFAASLGSSRIRSWAPKNVCDPHGLMIIRRGEQLREHGCGHRGPESYVVSVFCQEELTMESDGEICADCFVERYESLIERCGFCGSPIFPEDSYAVIANERLACSKCAPGSLEEPSLDVLERRSNSDRPRKPSEFLETRH